MWTQLRDGERLGDVHAFVPQEVDEWMVFGVTPRRRLQYAAADGEALPEVRVEQPIEFATVQRVDRRPEPLELVAGEAT